MEIRRFDSPNEMLLTCKAWLEADAAIHNLILGSLYKLCALEDELKPFEAMMFVVSDQNEVKLAFLKIVGRELMMSAARGELGNAMEVAATFIAQEYPETKGIVGPEPMNEVFARAVGKPFRLGFSQRILMTKSVAFPKASVGSFRQAAANEAGLLAEWFQAFFLESLDKQLSIENATRRVREKIENGVLWVWENESLVSMASVLRPTRAGVTISMVYTPPGFRSKGYASNTVGHLTQKMLDSGKTFCCLHTDAANPASNKIYEAIGYQEVGKGSLLLFE